MPAKFKLGIDMDRSLMYLVYQNQAANLFITLFRLLLKFANIKIFVTLFSGTGRHTKLKRGKLVDSGLCIVHTGIRLLLLICFSFFISFLSNWQTFDNYTLGKKLSIT